MSSYLETGIVIDAHHHLWDLEAISYPWLMAKGVKRFFGDPTPIQKNYLSSDLQADAGPLKLAGSVHIQVGAADALQEAAWVESQTQEHDLPSVQVVDTQLQEGNLAWQLEQLAANSSVRGVRQIIGRHATEDAKTGSGHLIKDPMWRKGLKMLAGYGLSFDLQLTAAQYQDAIEAVEITPETKVAICHFGSPWDQGQQAFERWFAAMEKFAALPNLYFKFSGFSMLKPTWTHADISPYIETALRFFGPERCMVGSNYPVDGLHRPYGDIFKAVEKASSSLGAIVQKQIFHDTAKAFYRF